MHRRRGVGVTAVRRKQTDEARCKELSQSLESENAAHVEKFVGSFRETVEAFARKHRDKIQSEPAFRARFSAMCTEIGVDPLRSSKGVWASVLGVGEFYYELGVKIARVCLATRPANGGLLGMDELLHELNASNRSKPATKDDVRRAVSKLRALGSGFAVVHNAAVLSVPMELNSDAALVIDAARARGVITLSDVAHRLGGSDLRARRVVGTLQKQGILWVDQADGSLYFPSLWLVASLRAAVAGEDDTEEESND